MVRLVSLGLIVLLATAKGQQMRGALTNASIVTLASAGFDEQFIVDTVAVSRTQFDTSVEAMAALAKVGISEGVIRAMMAASRSPAMASAPAVASVATGGPDASGKKPVALAIAAHEQYSESKQVLWGVYKRRVGVGAGSAGQGGDRVAQHLGAIYEKTRAREGSNGY